MQEIIIAIFARYPYLSLFTAVITFLFFINNTYAIIIQKLIYSRLIPAASTKDSANVRAATILNDRLRFLCFVIAGIVTDHVILL